MRTLLRALCVILVAASAGRGAAAEPLTPTPEAIRILAIEMRRGPAAELRPYVAKGCAADVQALALRALGRIGEDDPEAIRILGECLAAPCEEPALHALLLWACGISRAAVLAEPVRTRLGQADPALRAAAAAALGWLQTPETATWLEPLLSDAQAPVRAAALLGLARLRDSDVDRGVAASALAQDADAAVRQAARLAAWMMAAGRKEAVRKAGGEWVGEPQACEAWCQRLGDSDVGVRLDAVRILGVLLPPELASWPASLAAAVNLQGDPDARVVQDWLWRILKGRIVAVPGGSPALLGVHAALGHDDPRVRALAAETLGARADLLTRQALSERLLIESDARVRETLAVELARCGDESAWQRLAQRGPRAQEEILQELTDVRVALASPRPEALAELLAWTDPGSSQRIDLHAAGWLEILGALESRQVAGLDVWLEGLLSGAYAIGPFDRHFVLAAAVGVVASQKIERLLPRLLDFLEAQDPRPAHEDIRSAVAAALGDWLSTPGEQSWRAQAQESLTRLATKDPSPWVRRAAREALTRASLPLPPLLAPGQVNAWKGVPRALEAWPEVDPKGEDPWLNEAEILQLALWIQAERPLIALDTTQGTLHVALLAELAPVHCVSLLNAVRNGVYTDTRWHRVEPDFVIQGGDPHGHGGGNAGWMLPDEISPEPYERGVLGMPKSTKDDGGCQLFFMHSHYYPLNERYTAFGRVVSGMEVVDRIRVGDRILRARVLRPRQTMPR